MKLINQGKLAPLSVSTGLTVLTLAWSLLRADPPQELQTWSGWLVNDEARPKPVRVIPAAEPGQAPSDAVVLFDGKNLDAWDGGKGPKGEWVVEDGTMFPQGRANNIRSKQEFGDCQVHVEFRIPKDRKVEGQKGANSGVFLMGIYEVQVNQGGEENSTYSDGMPGAIYGQAPPLADAGRPQGEWQVYDILFRAPKFDADGKVTDRGLVSVLMNGVCVQHGWVFEGSTKWHQLPKWEAHPEKGPLVFQFHGDPVEYRNVWVREIPAYGWDHKKSPQD